EQRRRLEKEISSLGRQITDLNERLAIEQAKITQAKSGARSAASAFIEWMQKKRTTPENRTRLHGVLLDLVEVISCNPQCKLGIEGPPSAARGESHVRPPDAGEYIFLRGEGAPEGDPSASLEVVFHVKFRHSRHGKELGVIGFR